MAGGNIKLIRNAGFRYFASSGKQLYHLPDDILKDYLNEEEITQYKAKDTVIRSITVYAENPLDCYSSSSRCF